MSIENSKNGMRVVICLTRDATQAIVAPRVVYGGNWPTRGMCRLIEAGSGQNGRCLI